MRDVKVLQKILLRKLFRISLDIELMVLCDSHISFDMSKKLLSVCNIKLLDALFDPPDEELLPEVCGPVLLVESHLQPPPEVFNWVENRGIGWITFLVHKVHFFILKRIQNCHNVQLPDPSRGEAGHDSCRHATD